MSTVTYLTERRERYVLGLVALLGAALTAPLGAATLQGPVGLAFESSLPAPSLNLQATGDVSIDFAGASWAEDVSVRLYATDSLSIDASAAPPLWPSDVRLFDGAEPVAVAGDVWLSFSDETSWSALTVSAGRNLYAWNLSMPGGTGTLVLGSAPRVVPGGDISGMPQGTVEGTIQIGARGAARITDAGGTLIHQSIVPLLGGDIRLELESIQSVPAPGAAILLLGGISLFAAFVRRRAAYVPPLRAVS